MAIKDLLDVLDNEISAIHSTDFDIEVTETLDIPDYSDPNLTFENFDENYKKVKTVETCVLYADIRKSTKLNLEHYPTTMAKLYSSFIRGMIRAAEEFNGHVRNIVGDRIMVVFDCPNCFSEAVATAILMNTISKAIINRCFTNDAFKCGIGIDYGKMMVVKCGTIKHGEENANYKSLVWAGKPANIASKLTDAANQSSTYFTINGLDVGFYYKLINQWSWNFQTVEEFVNNIEFSGSPNMRYKDENFSSCFATSRVTSNFDSTPPILMTESVYNGFKENNPHDNSIKNGLWRKKGRKIPGFSGTYYGGDVTFEW
jgi:class 3 adenylate cyclase